MESFLDRQFGSHLHRQPALPRVRNKLGGSHTVVTYPALDALTDVDDSGEAESAIRPSKSLNLYLHIAFCEYICAFCHYTKLFSPLGEDNDRISAYLQALSCELDLRKDVLAQSEIASVYIGGGTPTSIVEPQLARLLTKLTSMTRSAPSRFCVETSPRSLVEHDGKSKLLTLRDFGVNRISIGVQSFNDDLLKRHRGHTQHVVLSALDVLRENDINWNLDLIQDLPGQNEEMILDDLRYVDRYRPNQVTWYILRPEREAAWYKPISHGHLLDLPTMAESVRFRKVIIDGMISLGYVRSVGGRFFREDDGTDDFKRVRNSTEGELLGFGASAYSHGWGWFFRNITDHKIAHGVNEYMRQCMSGRSPIRQAFVIDASERKAGARVVGARSRLDRELLADDDVDSITARKIAEYLQGRGLFVQDGQGGFSITEEGLLYEEEICSLFYSCAVKQTLSARGRYWLEESGMAELKLAAADCSIQKGGRYERLEEAEGRIS